MYAAVGGNTPTVRLLLRRGASAQPAGSNGWTALTIASAKGFADVVALLLGHGADVNARDVYGWTPLSRAAYEKRTEVVRLLLEQPGLAVDAVDDQGATALHHAAAQGATPVVQLLIAYGADRELEDKSGRTAAMRARESGYPSIAMLVDQGTSRP
jgi:ankyrin repeat protein